MELLATRIVNQRLVIRLVATVVVVVFALGVWSTGGGVDLRWLRFYSAGILVATALLWLWDQLLWKLPFMRRMRGIPRNVTGTWRGTLTSHWEDPASGQRPSPKTAYLVVRQTASTVSVILLTDESKSVSSLAKVSGADGMASLDYIYLNRPSSSVEHRSRMHYGSTSLDITGVPATRMQGAYWTNRDTQGELDFVQRVSRTAEDFDEAARCFAGAGRPS
jgi:hypothetical protein